jgi:hypothetical protein
MPSGFLPSRFPMRACVILSETEGGIVMLDVLALIAVAAAFAAAGGYAFLSERL